MYPTYMWNAGIVTPPSPSLDVVHAGLIALAARITKPVDFIVVELWPSV
jgi:hypothetical protein